MNPLGPLAAGIALTPLASRTLGRIAHSLSFPNLLSAPSGEPPVSDKASLGDSAPAEVTALQAELTQRLKAAGIELNDPIVLGLNSWGEIEVRSPHLQVGEIENLLNQDRQLLQRFQMTALTTMAVEQSDIDDWTALHRFELTIG